MSAPFSVVFADRAGEWARFEVATTAEARALLDKYASKNRVGLVFGADCDQDDDGLDDCERYAIWPDVYGSGCPVIGPECAMCAEVTAELDAVEAERMAAIKARDARENYEADKGDYLYSQWKDRKALGNTFGDDS